MPRNHPRLNQTSISMLQTWRANVDLQILVYESNPEAPDLREISKVTDYVVAYSCKGNATLREEIETNKNLILSQRETTADKSELKRVAKQVMNKAASSRLIPKAEASVLLANLSLTTCSEYIEPISISNSRKLTVKATPQKNNFLQQYQRRPLQYEQLSLHAYYEIYQRDILNKKPSIPHYIGVSRAPVFPVTEEYARHVLVVYKPWREYPCQPTWKKDFESFIRSPMCPKSARLTYDRVMQRFYDRTTFIEPKASHYNSRQPISQDDNEIMLLTGLSASSANTDTTEFSGVERGNDFPWCQPPVVRFR
jgi:hypothetical protein